MACKGNINIVTKQKNNAGWSSLVARRAHNPKVVGSNPAPATISLEVSNPDTTSFFRACRLRVLELSPNTKWPK